MLLLTLVFVPFSVSASDFPSKDIDVNLTVKPYAQIEADHIGDTDWIEFSEPKDESLGNRLAELSNNDEDLSPTTEEGAHFSGRGGETRWARKKITIGANVPVTINASATYPVDDNGNLMVSDSASRVFYTYLISQDPVTTMGPIVPGQESFITSFNTNYEKEFVLASKFVMPEEFWNVEAGTYMGTVTFTVTGN